MPMPKLIRPFVLSLSALLLAACGGAKQEGKPAAARLCYPATAQHPLEDTLVLNTSGGTYWEAFANAHLAAFERECGVTVRTVVSTRNFPQMRAYVQRGSVPYDVSYSGQPWEFGQAVRENLLERLPDGFWQDLRARMLPGSYNAYGTWLDTHSEVVVYDSKRFAQDPPRRWADLWDLRKYPGPRTFYDHPFMLVAALLADGVPKERIYPLDDAKLRRAFAKLDRIRPSIKSFWTTGDEPIQGIARGDFSIGVAQSGRVVAGKRNGYPVEMAWDQNLQSSAWLFIPRGAAHPRAAQAFLHFVVDPRRQAAFARATGYGGSARGLEQELPPQERQDLTTSGRNRERAAMIDADWWRENGARVQRYWQQWVATGKVDF